MSENVVGALLRDIIRVAEKRGRWCVYAREDEAAGLSYQVGLTMMKNSLDAAASAIERQDVVACLQALQDLRGFDSHD